ncbi:hypothetical protein [Parabacteroides sp. PF5-6]|uniref:hypothetical protein n=1 Tax=Parabacteroides sp. PF5-6 TaxID=1742403 RepID=UPI002405866C|nr:hypothetical protein [Parabacteroides sp. PF5-6]MDF9830185.1 hypothetical protein [Parabacteroides sp. PF5-6]
MNTLLKYIGVFVVLVGVAILAVPYLMNGSTSNTLIATGMTVALIGYFGHIIINKKLAD